MMEPIVITTRDQYELCKQQGFEPLLGLHLFPMDIRLRVAIQRELFGTGHTPQENERFYRWCWDHYPHRCAETMRPLREYSATYVSHILTRGAHPEMAHDPRNVNILSFDQHNRWENGDRKNMRIFAGNQIIIEQLKREYATIEL